MRLKTLIADPKISQFLKPLYAADRSSVVNDATVQLLKSICRQSGSWVASITSIGPTYRTMPVTFQGPWSQASAKFHLSLGMPAELESDVGPCVPAYSYFVPSPNSRVKWKTCVHSNAGVNTPHDF